MVILPEDRDEVLWERRGNCDFAQGARIVASAVTFHRCHGTASRKNASYRIEDPFFRFWFRYVFRNVQLVELGRFEILRKMVAEDLDVFTGQALEQYFWWKFVKESDYISMGAWWDRKGENEIDLVCESPVAKKRLSGLTFFEVKRDASRIDLKALEAKVAAFFEKHPELKNGEPKIKGLSLEDM